MKTFLIYISLLIGINSLVYSQNFTEILGRPTDASITMNILFDQSVEVFCEYGTVAGVYPYSTDTLFAIQNNPIEIEFSNLTANTKYFYHTKYRLSGSTSAYSTGPNHKFHTSRPTGSHYKFAIEADPHMDTNALTTAYELTLQNILSKNPDFMIDLGDNFMSEKLPVITQSEVTNRHILYRNYYGKVCHSVPLFLVLGNHEGELGWRLDGTAASLPVMAANTRKLYYSNPLPNSFYSGDTIAEDFVGLRQNYYSWEWGDALFIVLDPYWYTTVKPNWGWTLGEEQYNWFQQIISNSQAKFKFVFCHQLVGGNGNDARGGAEFAHLWEMGGYNQDSTWGFIVNRPGWTKPIHEIMLDNHASIFFHGHDHFFGKQDKDGIVYQEVPQPASKNITTSSAAQYGYVNGVIIPSRGYLLITVSDSTTKVDYIRTYLPSEEDTNHHNGDIAYSYTLTSLINSQNNNINTENISVNQNYPNPFDTQTSIDYSIKKASHVTITIYDVFGRVVSIPVNQNLQAGEYTTTLNSNETGINSELLYCKIQIGNNSKCIKMICLH